MASKRQLYMRAGLNRAQANTSSMFGVVKNTRVIVITKATGPLTWPSFQHLRMQDGLRNMTYILPWGDRATAPSSKGFTISKASTPVSADGLLLKVTKSFACCDTNVVEMRISGFGTRHAEVQTRDCRHVPCQAGYLVCVSIGRSDSCHEADSPFRAITKVSRILNISAVVIVGIDRGITTIPHWRLRGNTWVIKSCGSAVACLHKEANRLYSKGHSLQRGRESGSSGHPIRHICSSPSV